MSTLMRRRSNWQQIVDEIAKCDVVCANCHRRRAFKRSNSWRAVGAVGLEPTKPSA